MKQGSRLFIDHELAGLAHRLDRLFLKGRITGIERDALRTKLVEVAKVLATLTDDSPCDHIWSTHIYTERGKDVSVCEKCGASKIEKGVL